jgi:hypothetical protein
MWCLDDETDKRPVPLSIVYKSNRVRYIPHTFVRQRKQYSSNMTNNACADVVDRPDILFDAWIITTCTGYVGYVVNESDASL